MSGRAAAAAGLGAGAVALGVAAGLLHRTLTLTEEIRRYARDIDATGGGVVGNTDLAAGLAALGGVAARIRAVVAPRPAPGGGRP